ncbi:hypothetical protein NFX39_01775 [Fructobacillus sp. W13]|uniref:Integral membrane protein n=1 Tax=Fructobacillus apis TaxID=2935017 RepID=A0ABT0ZPC3_9LACO|nr:hypothetical protein [Fructobacillus apis]MCO0831823.1 hypothetical protein [Fructobacillus apis]
MSKIKQYVIWNFYGNTFQTVLLMIFTGLFIFNFELAAFIVIGLDLLAFIAFSYYVKKKLNINMWKVKSIDLVADERERDILTKVNAEQMQTYFFIGILAFSWGLLFFSDGNVDFAFSKCVFILWVGLASFLPGYRFMTLWYKYDKEY